MSEFLVMGFPASSDANLRGEFATLLSELAEVDLGVAPAASYAELAGKLHDGSAQLAWLSPIPYIALAHTGTVSPLVYNERATKHYASALLVQADSHVKRIADLRGARAAWVDKHSAAGYVVPRIELARAGVDPRSELGEQNFYGSHEAVARAIASREADFGATFAHREGSTFAGPFTHPDVADRVRVLTTFGKIPSDLIVARSDLAMDLRVRLTRALRAMNADEIGRRVIRELFEIERFRLLDAEAYESLQAIARNARDQGLLE
ncbi:MAG TPA: phosphate/phosphite/phosphonate ABC transporter substrate-binding protein [Polyangiaceae bacterium]|jgi:phosphonate transport system substrate-binding protein